MNGRWYFTRRAVAMLIDYFVYGALWFLYVRYFGAETDEGWQVSGCGHGAVLLATWAAWLPLPEALFGMTFGKWAVGLEVTDMKGGSVTFGQAFVRRLLDPIDLGACFGVVAFIVAKTSPRSQRLGDLIAKTVVSEARRA